MTDPSVNIVIGGEAGQGLVTIGLILAKGLVRRGYSIVVTQGYQSRIRGGHNTFAIRAGADEILAPKEAVDLLICLDAQTAALHKPELSTGGLIVMDSREGDGTPGIRVPFKELASL